MGVALYRPGKGHVFNGIECEMRVFDPYNYLPNLDQGWFYSPDEFPYHENESEEEKLIRTEAKKSGIKHWWMKSIPNLEEELTNGGDQD